MKWLPIIFLSLLIQSSPAQNLSGKWFGKVSQQPGGYTDLYDLELDLSHRKNIWGDSYAYFENKVKIRIGLSGHIQKDSIYLSESIGWVREDLVPWDWVACIKKFNLQYRTENNYEYMEGSWSGFSKEDMNDPCIPGKVILSRSIEGLNKFLEERKDSLITLSTVEIPSEIPPIPDFNTTFLNTEPKKITEIIVHHAELQIQLLDYLKPDNDTVSIYLNRNILARNVRISKRPALINFKLNPSVEVHEILMYAENLGLIPPNTSELILIDGDARHQVMITSDKEKSATITLRYKPGKSKKNPKT